MTAMTAENNSPCSFSFVKSISNEPIMAQGITDVYKRQDESHPNWLQDKKNPDRHGIRIPVLDENGIQKLALIHI